MTSLIEKSTFFNMKGVLVEENRLDLVASKNQLKDSAKKSFSAKVSELFSKKNDWCCLGKLSALPFSFRLTKTRTFIYIDHRYQLHELCFAPEFFKTELGKVYSDQEKYYRGYFKSARLVKKALRKMLEQQFQVGSCWGQVAAIMIAYGKEADHKKLVSTIDKTQVLFFQAMSYLRWYYKKEATKPQVQNEDHQKNHFEECRKSEIQVFQKMAKMTLVSAETFAPACDLYSELVIINKKYQEVSLRITFPHKEEAHASCLFLGKRPAIYDSLFGLVSYKTNEELFVDLKRYCERIQEYATQNQRGTFLEVFRYDL